MLRERETDRQTDRQKEREREGGGERERRVLRVSRDMVWVAGVFISGLGNTENRTLQRKHEAEKSQLVTCRIRAGIQAD